ncbi:MAG: type VI secretion system protein [Candidatus Azotimanducaceae bacterium]|jgi:type VI secretion system protein
MKLRLLKRIKGWEEAGRVSASEIDINEIMESMRDDLEKLFNTRRGTVLIDPDFGLPDFTHLMNGYSAPDLDEIQNDILQQVRSYENRLTKLIVVAQDTKATGNSLGFGLTAVFDHKNQEQSLSANIAVRDNGSVGVSL